MKISANVIIIVNVVTTPNASGVSNRANIIEVIGVTSFAAISVNVDHLVAVLTLVFSESDI